MLNKVMLAMVSACVITLSAATGVYKVTLFQDSVVNGQQLKAGNYKIEMKGDNTAVLKQGKQTVEIPAHLQTGSSKFGTTEVEYSNNSVQEIRVGGTNTKIVFQGANGTASGAE